MSEKNHPLGSHVSDHGYESIPPPPAYNASSSSYSDSATAPAMKSDSYHNNDAPPYEASRGYGQPRPNYYAPPQQYNDPSGQYTPPPQQYSAPPGQYTPPPQQYGGSPQVGRPYETSSAGFMGGKSKSNRKPLDPPPPCLSRPPQFFQRPLHFAAIKIPCTGSHLDSGFPLMYPGHVLHGHDVQELEWIRFLEDLSISGRLESGEKVKSHFLPMALGAGASGILISRAIQRRMKSGKANQVGSLVDIWNCYYFHLRGVNVTLMHGDRPLSGLQAPEVLKDNSSCSSSDSSSSSSSSDEESLRHFPSQYQQQQNMGDRKAIKKERRDWKREEKREQRNLKREEKRERRDVKKEERRARKQQRKEGKRKDIPYYLVVESRPM